jgi:peptidoglycan hydrolase CwlO-like protein
MRFWTNILTALLVLSLAFPVLSVQTAWAADDATEGTGEITADTPLPNILELEQQIEDAAVVYDDATRKIVDIEKLIEEANAQILEIKGKMPEARKRSNVAVREYYRMVSSSNVFLEMIFGATSLDDFFSRVEYSVRANQKYLDDINGLSLLNDELKEVREQLDVDKKALEDEQRRAEEALLDAQNARDVAEETAQKIAEATAAATAAEAAAAEAEAHEPEAPVKPDPNANTPSVPSTPSTPGTPSTPSTPSTPDPPSPPTPPSPPVTPEPPSERQIFVNNWAPRIDNYLAGSPLGGYGYAFASAAYDYGVDPRWSPAIAHLESSKGSKCFLPYNAWGWGNISWPDWETAIFAHVRGLSRGYGYTITEAAAQKYCPPNWEYWYSFISGQMTNI